MKTFAIILDGSYEARIERPAISQGYPVYSVALVCPRCLKVWARIESSDFADVTYEIHGSLCPEHDGGSLLANPTFSDFTDWDLLDLLPEPLLRREFNIAIKEALKCHNSSDISGPAGHPTAAIESSIESSTLG